MANINIAMCDDDDNIIDIMLSSIKTAFEKRGVTVEIETFNSADALGRRMKNGVFDLVFLDIEMPGTDGITFGESLRKNRDKTEIVYVSAREDRVFDAFKARPFGFVRKSNFLADLTYVINGFIKSMENRRAYTLTVKAKNGIVNVPIEDVEYFEGSGKFQLMYITGKKEATPIYRSMEKLEEELHEKGFIRIHKGIIVNYAFISRILTGSVELVSGKDLPLSRRKASDIKARYLELLQGSGSVIL